MNRLLQGDVGSGKTIVAFMGLVAAVEAGGQGAIMAPLKFWQGSILKHYYRWLKI